MAGYYLLQGSFRGDLKLLKFFTLLNALFPLRFSALFSLRKFCSVANLNFKCLAWHVCLEFLFDKNMYYESVKVFHFPLNKRLFPFFLHVKLWPSE